MTSTDDQAPIAGVENKDSFSAEIDESAENVVEADRLDIPYFFPLGMLIACVLLAMVDLAFLTEVVGQIINVGFIESLLISFGLGLVGIAFMVHLGYKEADRDHQVSLSNQLVHYGLWISLGVAISLARFYSAHILELESFEGTNLVSVLGTEVRQMDAVFAPIMLLLYLITGLGAKEATQSLLLNPGFHGALERWRLTKAETASEKQDAKSAARAKAAEARQEQEKRKKERLAARESKEEEKRAVSAKAAELEQQRLENERAKVEAVQGAEAEAARVEAEERLERERLEREKAAENKEIGDLRQTYYDAVQRYKQLESNFEKVYQETASLLAEIERIDADSAALNKAYANGVAVIDNAERSAQQQVAMLIHGKTGAQVSELTAVIAAHNGQVVNRGSNAVE